MDGLEKYKIFHPSTAEQAIKVLNPISIKFNYQTKKCFSFSEYKNTRREDREKERERKNGVYDGER